MQKPNLIQRCVLKSGTILRKIKHRTGLEKILLILKSLKIEKVLPGVKYLTRLERLALIRSVVVTAITLLVLGLVEMDFLIFFGVYSLGPIFIAVIPLFTQTPKLFVRIAIVIGILGTASIVALTGFWLLVEARLSGAI